ncbi:7841_t:CDS:2 [Entrophospora sp. SA101]|nr:7841_t:CDS:2 [Entrophospora sp. SA101]
MIHNLKGLTIQAFINQGENNQPIFHCSNGKFLATEKSMSAAVNTIYQQFLESIQSTSKTRISSPKYFGLVNENHLQRLSKGITFFPFMIKVDKFEMLVVNASYDGIKPANGYHITFVEKIQREYYLFSQYYINKQFHVDSYSLTTGEKKYKFQNSDVNELWESIGMFQNLSGRELFLLDNLELKNIIEESCVKFQTMCSDWNQMVFEKLHLEYMKNINNKDLTLSVLNHLHKRKSTLFEWHGLLYNFKIIEKNNSILDETMIRKTRAWKQLLMASGCKQIKIYRNKEYWSKADDIAADLETLELFPEINSHSNLNSSQELKNNELDSDANTFWKSFENAMNSNKRGPDGQHRILSIIAEEFTYSELKKHLNISNDSINAARKHARFYGEGAPISQEDRTDWQKY